MACRVRRTTVPFKIENDILIGEETPIDKIECVNVGDKILSTFKSKPDFIGQVDAATGEESTYRQMRERSVRCALWLKKQDVKSGDVVVICTHNHLNAYVPFLASLYIGAIANPWNEQSIKANIKHFISQVLPKVIFVNDDKASTVLEATMELHVPAKVIAFGSEVDGFVSLESILNGDFDEAEIDGFFCTKLKRIRDTAVILFSSGTTGFPKGVEVSHLALAAPIIHNFMPNTIHSDTVVLWFGSLNWSTSMLLTIRAMLLGVKMIKSSGFDSEKLCRLIETYKVTWILLETGMTSRLLKSNALAKYDISSLKTLMFGGSPIRREIHESLVGLLPNVSVLAAYGMTETCCLAYQEGTVKIGSTGYVAGNVRLMIADLDTGKPLGPNTRGEIRCKCTALMNSYYKNPEETAKVYDNNGWFCTGDVGYYDEDGEVFVIDRIKELIKYRGYQISPVEIEVLLQTHPAVLEAAVVSVPHRTDSEHPIAFVMKMPDVNVTEEELERLVAENLEDCKKLRAGVVFIKEIPHVSSGKVDRKKLRVIAKTYAKE